jgi:hypothetical protein
VTSDAAVASAEGSATGGADGGAVRVGGEIPINVCERRGMLRTRGVSACGGRARGGLAASGAGGATEIGLGAGGAAEIRAGGATDSAAGGGTERGDGATRVTSSSSPSSPAPQSVSISSVTGGTEGGRVRGGSLAVVRGGTDEAWPSALARSDSSLLTTVLGSHTLQMGSSAPARRAKNRADPHNFSRWRQNEHLGLGELFDREAHALAADARVLHAAVGVVVHT